MRGLTVRQPHARLIEIGEKTIELRSWTTRYRGDLLICAAAKAVSVSVLSPASRTTDPLRPLLQPLQLF